MQYLYEFLKMIRKAAIKEMLWESRMDLEPSFFSIYWCASYSFLISGFRNLENRHYYDRQANMLY